MAEEANPTGNATDNWREVVAMLTGYLVPERHLLFNTLTGNDGIPLMHVRLDHVGGPEWASGFEGSGGWHTRNTDYTIPFYGAHHSADSVSDGTQLHRYRAYITILGTVGSLPPSGQDVVGGGPYTSKVLKDKGGWNKEGEALDWDTKPLAQYVHGSMNALWELMTPPYSTHGFKNRDIKVGDEAYVDLASFTETAKTFDRVVTFFENSATTVGNWDNEDIGEGSKSWDGTSAAIFKALIHKLARNYEGYADQIRGDGDKTSVITAITIDNEAVTSQPARALADLQWVLYNQASKLYDAWQAWKHESSPQRWLYDMLQDARLELFDTQYKNTDFTSIGGPYYYRTAVVAKAEFVNSIVIKGTHYGPPSDMETWKKIGAEAVRRWDSSAQNFLIPAAAEAIVAISKAFAAAHLEFDATITDKDKRSLSDISAKEESNKEKKDLDKKNADAKAEADKDKDEAKKERDKDRAEAEKDKDEAKKERDKDRAEAEKDKDEAKKERDKD
ncbi:AAWKG family protein, partial [Streptomyces sp. NPDC052236]|uniref:AAWKG family protein n=1 Tax=Streptomyces sp. NPDC052236 TaxID=3365686 RepID=UPI0037CF2BE5